MNNKKGFSAYQLKLIAIAAMSIDHIAWMWVPAVTLAGQCMHTIGRITAPVMCYLLVEGYIHTHNLKRYTMRLGSFAVISAFAFCFYERGSVVVHTLPKLGMIYTLFLALLMLRVYDSRRISGWKQLALMGLLFLASFFGDWPGIGVVWPLMLYIYRDDRTAQMKLLAYTAALFAAMLALDGALTKPDHPYASLFQFGMLLAVPIIGAYNGRLGGKRCGKWFFYVYYPLHMVIIRLINIIINV